MLFFQGEQALLPFLLLLAMFALGQAVQAKAASNSSNSSTSEEMNAEMMGQEMNGSSMTGSSSPSSNASSNASNSSNSSSSSTSTTTEIVDGKSGKKKKVKKTVVTEVEEEETSEEKRDEAERKEKRKKTEEEQKHLEMLKRQKKPSNPTPQVSFRSMDLNGPEELAQEQRLKEEKERAEFQRNLMEQQQAMEQLEADFVDTNESHVNVRQKGDPFPACSDFLPSDTCQVLKPFCAVTETARAIRFLRERSDYILYLGKDIQKHIDFVKSMVPANLNTPYTAALFKQLDNIKSLLPSVSKTAPLIRLILDEDSEEDLERLLNAHLRFKQECERLKSGCSRMDQASARREAACRLYDSQCCCDGQKFQSFYRAIVKRELVKECPKARGLRKSIRRMVEASCAQTCQSCPTRFRLKEYAQELLECERDRKVPSKEMHVNIFFHNAPPVPAPQPYGYIAPFNLLNLGYPHSGPLPGPPRKQLPPPMDVPLTGLANKEMNPTNVKMLSYMMGLKLQSSQAQPNQLKFKLNAAGVRTEQKVPAAGRFKLPHVDMSATHYGVSSEEFNYKDLPEQPNSGEFGIGI